MTGAPVPVVPLAPPPPVVLAYGIGVDSTALLIEKGSFATVARSGQ